MLASILHVSRSMYPSVEVRDFAVIGKVDVIAVVDIVNLFVPPVVNPIESAAACHIPVF